MTPVNETYCYVPGFVIFWVIFVVSFVLFVMRITFLLRLLNLGRKWKHPENICRRIKYMLLEVMLQRCNLKTIIREDLSGIGHAIMFWGFGIFLIGYIIFIGLAGGLDLSSVLIGSKFEIIYSYILDLAGILVFAAVIWAIIRRYILRPERLRASFDAGVILILIALLMLLHFFTEGFGYIAYSVNTHKAPIGAVLSMFFDKMDIAENTCKTFHNICWWLHYFIIMGFMVYIPRSKHLHILTSPFNVFYKNLKHKGMLRLVDFEKGPSIGIDKIQEFNTKQLLDLFSCTECGRCKINCPANNSGKSLSPRKVILNLKDHFIENGKSLLYGEKIKGKSVGNMIEDVITEEVIWDCTTCLACQEICPVGIEPMIKLVEMRRHLVEQGRVRPMVGTALESIQALGNPFERPQSARFDWAEDKKVNLIQVKNSVDVLYWVGCAGAYDPIAREIPLAMISLLEKAKIDYALIGVEEICCGDPARRMGEEGLFQSIAFKNIEILKKYNFKRIITHCPHCFNILKNEYPQLGFHFEIQHHSEIILELIKTKKINLEEHEIKMTFHDPCYLGRYNGKYQQPRQVLNAIPKSKFVEMRLNRNKAMCCGAGGGQMWIQAEKGRRIEDVRIEHVKELEDVSIVTTACPYCTIMLDAASKVNDSNDRIRVMDIAELINKTCAP